MRRRQLKWLWKRLGQIAAMQITREEVLMKLGAARSRAPTAWRLVDTRLDKHGPAFTFVLNRDKRGSAEIVNGEFVLSQGHGAYLATDRATYFIAYCIRPDSLLRLRAYPGRTG